MKHHITVYLLAICVISCSKETPIAKLNTSGFDGKTIFITPSSKVKIAMNQAVDFSATGGSVVQNTQDTLVFTAPPAAGVYAMVAKNKADKQDSLVFRIMVTSRADVFRALQNGGYSLVFRHAAADVGVDQTATSTPNWWKSCDENLARQLNDKGKKDAQKIGSVLKLGQIAIERLLSSEFCRCFTTAELMGFGKVPQTHKDLTYFVYDEANRYANTMKVASSQPLDDKNTVIVTHAGFSENIPTVAPLTKLEWGDAAVFKLSSDQTSTYVTTLKITEFVELIR
jgi:phosphohistidine phosphatase SixA